MRKVRRFTMFILGGALALAPALQAKTCGGTGDVIGGYGWTAGRDAAFVPVAATTTTPATPINGSNTPIGGLAAGAANSAAFASVGRLFMDGNGGMFASSTPGVAVSQVGTYTVNSDCTVSATFTDTFATPGGAGLTPVQASVTFEGVLVQNANEIDLAQTGTATGTVVTLRKTKQYIGCTIDGVTGTFGLAASGVSTAAATPGGTPVSTPFNLSGRVDADGLGNFVQDSVGLASPLTQRQFTGTYTINADCSGSGTLVGADGKSRKFNFVVVGLGPNASTATQALAFAFSDTGVVGSGLAQQQ